MNLVLAHADGVTIRARPDVVLHAGGGFTISTHSALHPAAAAGPRYWYDDVASDPPPCTAPCPVLRHDLAADVLTVLNRDRVADGQQPLALDARLTACAEWKVLNLGANQYLDHADHAPPLDRGVADRFAVYYPTFAAWGENLAYAFLTAETVMTAFMSDDGHRNNILNDSWRGVGLAVAQASNGLLFWGQDFGSDRLVGPPDPPPVPSGAVLHQWLTTVLPLIQATTQHQKWLASRTAAGQADVAAWNRYLQNPTGPVPVMRTPYGKALVADLHLAASQP